MNYKEIKADLFNMDEKYYLVHCISKDLGMGKGIVVEFNKRYDMKNKMIEYKHQNNINIGDAVLLENIFNLITKANYWGKPTYGTLECALCDMKSKIIENDIKYLAMPKIGCGLDRLAWNKVRDMIQELFIDLDVEIIVCYK